MSFLSIFVKLFESRANIRHFYMKSRLREIILSVSECNYLQSVHLSQQFGIYKEYNKVNAVS